MADDKLRWVFEIYDRASTPAADIAKHLRNANDQFRQAQALYRDTGGALAEFGGKAAATALEAAGMGAALGPVAVVAAAATAGVTALTTAVVEMETALVKGGFELAKFGIKQAAFKQATETSLETITGSKEQAQSIFGRSIKFAAYTPLETVPVVDTMKRLLSAGFNQKQSETLLAFGSDVSSLSGKGNEGLKHLVEALTVIRGRDKLDEIHLREVMGVASGAGLNMPAVWDQIAKVHKTTREGAQALISSGMIKGDEAIVSILNAYRGLHPGKEIGQASLDQSDKILGLLSTLSSRAEEVFLTFKGLEELPGVKAFTEALKNVVEATDTTKGAGLELATAIRTVFSDELETVFGPFAGKDGLGKVEAVLRQAKGAVEDLGAALKVTLGMAEGLAKGFGKANGIDLSGPLDEKKIERLVSAFEKLGEAIGGFVGLFARLGGGALSDTTTVLDSKASAWERLKSAGSLGQYFTLSGLGAKAGAGLRSIWDESNKADEAAQVAAADRDARDMSAYHDALRPRGPEGARHQEVTVQVDLHHQGERPEDVAHKTGEVVGAKVAEALDKS